MLNEDNYEILKSSFVESQRLFTKLAGVADSIANIDYDESGLYQEEEEMYERHWLKLSSKIVDAVSGELQDFSIELLKNSDLEIKELRFNLKDSENISKIYVDFSNEESISITQVS